MVKCIQTERDNVTLTIQTIQSERAPKVHGSSNPQILVLCESETRVVLLEVI